MAIEAMLDVAQQRLTRSALIIEGDGSRWDRDYSSTCLITEDGMAFVRPYQLTPEWDTTTTVAYRRWGRSDYRKLDGTTTLSASQWAENHRDISGNIYLESLGVQERVYSLKNDWPINRGFALSLYVPEGIGQGAIVMDFGWGELGTTGTVFMRYFADGKIEIWKYFSSTPTRVATYTIAGRGASTIRKNIRGNRVELILLPCARRELLIVDTEGGEVRHAFDDLSPDVINTITPSGRVWWYWWTGKASVQCSELRFPIASPASLVTQIDELREAPPTSSTFAGTIYWDRPSAADSTTSVLCQLMEANAPSTVFAPNGVKVQCRLLVQLSPTGEYTPFVHAAYVRQNPTTGDTPAENLNVTSQVTSLSLSVPEGVEPATGSLTLRQDNDSNDTLPWQSNRPFRLSINDSVPTQRRVLWGLTQKPKDKEAQREVAGGFRPITIPFVDAMELLDITFEEDSYPYDGWLLHNAIGDLLTLAGWPTTSGARDITTSTVRLDYTSPKKDTQWSWKPQAGDTIYQWLRKIHEAFAQTWYMGVRAGSTGRRFYFNSPSALGTTAAATIWLHKGATPTGRIPCYAFEEETLPAEASAITVYGFNTATRTLIRARWADSTLEDPTLDAVDRPRGWIGQREPVTLFQPKFTNAQTVGRARDQLAALIGVEQRIAQWECPLLWRSDHEPVWRGDCVAIRPGDTSLPGGNPEGGIYRVKSLSLNWRKDGFGSSGKRSVTYVGERVADLPS